MPANTYLFMVKAKSSKPLKLKLKNNDTWTIYIESLPSSISISTLPSSLQAPGVVSKTQDTMSLSWMQYEKIAPTSEFQHYEIKYKSISADDAKFKTYKKI